MSLKDEIRAELLADLTVTVDPYMAEHGFARPKKSFMYKRKYKQAIQVIEIELQLHPKDNPNAVAAIYPIMEVQVPTVDNLLHDMLGGNLGLMEGSTKGLSNQPIEFTSQKAEKARWFVYQADSIREILQGVRSFIERWAMPFLDSYAAPEDIVAADEREDGRMVADRAHFLRVVAASLVCNRKDYALALMERRLGAPGARKRYQQIFDYINRRI